MMTMQKTEFPKVKKSPAMPFLNESGMNVSGQSAERSPQPGNQQRTAIVIFSFVILVAQLVIFIMTWKMFNQIRSYSEPVPNTVESAAGANAGPGSAGISKANGASQKQKVIQNIMKDFNLATPAGSVREVKPQMIADFNRPDFVTNFNTKIYAIRNSTAGSLLNLEFDTNKRFGSYGNALAVIYDFTAAPGEVATLVIDLPLIDISGFNKLAFKLLADFKHNKGVMSPIRIQLVSHSGEMIEHDVTDFFTFWKKYDIELWKNQDSPPNEFLLKQIRMTVARSAGVLTGGWHIDDMVLE